MSEDKSLTDILDSSSSSGHMDPDWLASLPKGKINILINASGEWFYQGQPFQRKSMVELLAKQLVYYQGKHCLVAPEQLLSIEVEDCPFVVTLVEAADAGIALTTNVGDQFILGEQGHAMSMRPLVDDTIETPVVEARPGLLARFSRAAWYQLVDMAELAEEEKGSCLRVRSAGSYHLLGYVDEDAD